MTPAMRGAPGMVEGVHSALAGTRLMVVGTAGLVVSGLASTVAPWQMSVLAGWDAAAAAVVASILWMAYGKDAAATAALATREDDSRAAADALLVAACLASLLTVAVGVVKASHTRGTGEAVITALALLSVILSWAAVNAVFTLRYARLYYTQQGGIDFNDDDQPDYHDFPYVAVTVGMTHQVSDTDLTTKSMRRTATRHALLSYLFGTFVVAMTINVVAGLVR